jgi:hypothetical protein
LRPTEHTITDLLEREEVAALPGLAAVDQELEAVRSTRSPSATVRTGGGGDQRHAHAARVPMGTLEKQFAAPHRLRAADRQRAGHPMSGGARSVRPLAE